MEALVQLDTSGINISQFLLVLQGPLEHSDGAVEVKTLWFLGAEVTGGISHPACDAR